MKIQDKSIIKFHGLIILLIFFTVSVLGQQKIKLVILHTNDTHSQVEPTEKSSLKTADMGGYARRMGVIKQIREHEKNVLLVDAGDYCQGTPYFNFFNGRVEIDAMNRMKYDAGTLGNHEFDNGIDTLAEVLKKAQFPLISSNYDLSKTALNGMIKPYIVLKRAGLRIGIMALDVNPNSLIFQKNYKGMIYEDPIEKANEISTLLKKKEKCDVIICLSHLGAVSPKGVVNDFEVAHNTRYIDVIIGGHSHSMVTNTTEKNADGKPIVIAQMGKSGLYLGKVELELEKKLVTKW
ncbi:MAG: metallophosphatase [Paludibacter sp.]|nr:metallophosphatase [Paludibacter sp.]